MEAYIMLTLERQNVILDILKKDKAVTISKLSEFLSTSATNIRRDLEKMEKKRLVKRTYGGAVLVEEGFNVEIPLAVREVEHREIKNRIARTAARLVGDDDTVFIDASTTTKEMTNFFRDKINLTVITNGIRTITDLAEAENVTVYGLPGKLRKRALSLVGSQAESRISDYWASKLFFSCTGLCIGHGAMDYSDEEAEIRKKMMDTCQKIILLCDHTKFGFPAFYRICSFSQIDVLITDRQLSGEWETLLIQNGIEVIYADDSP
ncbi:MAG: DeoR/GlpR family DNA-binding transcription regulator [Treponema sp.]|nr:DeoR/GlpR family DNA-binding transcription regulator [Treponema sp.]